MIPRVLVLGVGNLLLSDEGVGVHVARLLQTMDLPDDVEVVDGGTTGFELLRLCAGRSDVIILDSLRADEPAGTVVAASPEELDLQWHHPASAHGLGLQELLSHAAALDPPPRLHIVGIVPATLHEPGMTLSSQLQELLPSVAATVAQLCARIAGSRAD